MEGATNGLDSVGGLRALVSESTFTVHCCSLPPIDFSPLERRLARWKAEVGASSEESTFPESEVEEYTCDMQEDEQLTPGYTGTAQSPLCTVAEV